MEQEAEDALRVAALADWVLDEQMRRAAGNHEWFEQYMADPTQRMRADELDILQRAVDERASQSTLIAAALRNGPTPAFLEVTAQLLENNGFINAAGQHLPQVQNAKMDHLTDEQVEYAEARLIIKEILVDAYGDVTSENALGRRASHVATYLLKRGKEEARAARHQYDETANKELPRLRWMLRTSRFLTRTQ